ncbi:MAG: BlaI/MecI/CopY family transcriptional regulator [Firmicutes bacterium]|nr:BlaI/MecI/CopY family transcriptional regulator [Bacillota bacterium]
MTTIVGEGVMAVENNQITNSEWRVMSVLWEESPLSSREIIQRLNIDKAWSDNTVKTFISRLEKKGLIGFKTQGRKHLFYPLLGEKKCVENEMFMIVRRIYGDQLRYSTNHFEFYGDNKIDFINKIALYLENNHGKILHELNSSLDTKQSVYIYKNQLRLHSALGVENAPLWIRAGGSWGIIHLAPESSFIDKSPEKIALHVFTEIILYRIDSNIPSWISKGVSAYYGDWLSKERIINVLQTNIDNINLKSLLSINEDFIKFAKLYGFEISYTIVKYICEKYGTDTLSNFIRNYDQYSEVFGVSKEQFFEGWMHFIKNVYF